MISLSAIAKRAGVSVATVSLALRGKTVAKATADKVRTIAEEMGYRPNPLLASLATKKFRSAKCMEGTPLAIFDFPDDGGIAPPGQPYHNQSRILAREATNLGYSPEIHNLTNSSQTKSLSRILYHRMVQGIILLGNMDMSGFGDKFDWTNYAVVACNRFSTSLPFHTVRANVFKSVKTVFFELLGRGYKRIGFASGRHERLMEDDEARYGAARAMEICGASARTKLFFYSGPIFAQKPFLEWVNKSRLDAVVGFNNLHYWHLRDGQFRIPEDLGFAALHLDTPTETDICSGLENIEDETSRQSVLLLDQFIRNREQGRPKKPMELLLTQAWHDGKTLRPRP
jgi:DNA-binding LacI/PurR family transcriptional regulator